MDSRAHLRLLLALLVSSSLALADAAGGQVLRPSVAKAVHGICGVTTYKSTCLKAARVFSKDYNLVISKDTMMEMHMKLGILRTRAAKAAVEKLKKTSSAPKAAARFRFCIGGYGDMLTDFKRALASLKRGDQGTTMVHLSAMFPNLEACDNEFDADKVKNPLARRNRILRRISSNALSIGRSKWHILF